MFDEPKNGISFVPRKTTVNKHNKNVHTLFMLSVNIQLKPSL